MSMHIPEDERPSSFFAILDPNINDFTSEPEIAESKVKLIAQTSRAAFQDFNKKQLYQQSKKMVDENNLPESTDPIIIFHYGFQYGFATANIANKMEGEVHQLFDLLTGRDKSSEQPDMSFESEELVVVTIDNERGFVQIKAGDKLVIFDKSAKIELIEV